MKELVDLLIEYYEESVKHTGFADKEARGLALVTALILRQYAKLLTGGKK